MIVEYRFKIGDKVKCADEDKSFITLQKDKEYTVKDYVGPYYMQLSEVEGVWSMARFTKVLHSPQPAELPAPLSPLELETPTGGTKHDSGKPDLSLIPYISLVEQAKAFMVGEKKYGRYNYCKGHGAHQLASAAMRHISAWFNGEEYDPKDGQHHLGAAQACCSMILRQQELGTLRDNRYMHQLKVKNENNQE